MQRKTSSPKKQPQLRRLPAEPSADARTSAIERRPQAAAIAKLLAGAAKTGEGRRILVFGATRQGKTTFTKRLVAAMLDQGAASYLLIHDQKYPQRAQYDGAQATTVEQVRELVAAGNHVIVCRPPLTVEDCAQVVRDLVEGDIPAVLLIDETIPALKVNEDTAEPMNRVWMGPTPIWLLLQGGGLGGSVVMLNNLPLQVPTSMLDSASDVVCFNVGGRSLNALVDQRTVTREAAEKVIPRMQPGELLLFSSDQDWDRTIYGPA
jgi:hypothetical protein